MSTTDTESVLERLGRQERFARLTTSRDRSRPRARVNTRSKAKDTPVSKKDTPGKLPAKRKLKVGGNPPSKRPVRERVEKLPAVVQRFPAAVRKPVVPLVPSEHRHRQFQPDPSVPLWDSDEELLVSMIEQLLASFRHDRIRRELMDFPTEVKMLLDPTIPHSAWCRP